MSTYTQELAGLHLVLRLYGSAVPRAAPFAALSAGLAALLHFYPGAEYFEALWRHPYPYQLFAFIVGFILVFRSNYGYSRYWQGRTSLQRMGAAWSDMCMRAMVFEATACAHNQQQQEEGGGGRGGGAVEWEVDARRAPLTGDYLRAVQQVLHMGSLTHALCIQALRRVGLVGGAGRCCCCCSTKLPSRSQPPPRRMHAAGAT